jgi:hypothetical protein
VSTKPGQLQLQENRIKEQFELFADRTSCHKWWPNQFRLLLAGLAYTLLTAIRRLALTGTELARAQVGTIRLKLLKIGAVIWRNTRRIRFCLSSACPDKDLFATVALRLTASHAVKKGRRYRYYVSGALITETGTDRPQGWRLAAQEIEDAVIKVLADALTRPAMLLERFDTAGIPGDQNRKMLDRATRFVAALNRSPAERAKVVRDLIEKVVIEEDAIMIRVRRRPLLGRAVMPPASENPGDSPIELTAPVAFRRRGVEMRLVLPAVALQNDRSRCDPTLIKAIARGRAWFEELAAGRARSLRELAERDGITRRYVRRLVDLAFLCPELVEAILQGRQPVELTATRLTELDLPLDWTDQRRLLAN